MNFISKFLKESKLNYKQKLIKKKINSQTQVSRRSITLNGEKINFKFIKVNNENEKEKYLKCSRFENFRICYLITWINKFDTINFIEPVDLIVCDLEWKVLKLYRSLPADSRIEFNRNCHVFVMAHNSIEYNEISIDDYLRPF